MDHDEFTADPARVTLADILRTPSPDAVTRWLQTEHDPGVRVDQLADLDSEQIAVLGEMLTPDSGEELLETLEPHQAADLLTAFPTARAGALLDALHSDVAAEILRDLPRPRRDALLAAVPAAQAAVLRGLLDWPEHSAAAHMIPDVFTISDRDTAGEAIETVRTNAAQRRSDSQTGGYVYVVDGDERLAGVVSFRALVLAAADTPVTALMNRQVITVAALEDPETAGRIVQNHRLLAVPVVDDDRRLLGIITADAAGDIAEEEATEDAERQGGSQPLDVPYLRASPWMLWRKRILWLLVLFVAEAYTSSVLQAFEDELEKVVTLAIFIPLLIGTGGNTGTQITTTLVRAMATGQLRLRNLGGVLGKELPTAFMIGATMAVAGLVRAFTLGVGWEIMLTVSLSVAAIVVWSSLVASIMPLLLSKTRIDPAVVSAPMIATIVDGTGLLIYFSIAKLVLGL